jgi:hypothetical protein
MEHLKAAMSVVDADGRDRGAKDDSSLLESLSKNGKRKLYLKQRSKAKVLKEKQKKEKAQEDLHKSTDFVKFGDVVQAPPQALPSIVLYFHHFTLFLS